MQLRSLSFVMRIIRSRSLLGQLLLQPRARECPFAGDGRRRHLDDFPYLLDRQSHEELEFDDPRLTFIELGQPIERIVYAQNVDGGVVGRGEFVGEGDDDAAVAPAGERATGVVDQEAAHDLGRDAKEVRPVFPLDGGLAEEAEVGLVDEGGRGEGVVGAFFPEVAGGQTVEFGVDGAGEGITGGRVTGLGAGEEVGDGPGGGGHYE